MSTLVLDHRDLSLDYEAECLLIRQPQQPPRSIPLGRLARILVMHSVQISTRLIGHCQRLGVDFIVLNGRYHEHSFAVLASHQRQAARRVMQYQLVSDQLSAFPLANRLIQHKLAVTRHCLWLQGAESHWLEAIAQRRQQSQACTDIAQLRGHEGIAQREAFRFWCQQLPAGLGFRRRERRPPPDPVNALLSLSFTLLYQEAARQCLVHGLDPWLGVYHQLTPSRLSLACDLMEPLRPMVELWVIRIFLEKELDLRHFSTGKEGCRLGKQGREIYYRLWHDKLPAWSKRLGRYSAMLAKHLEHDLSPDP